MKYKPLVEDVMKEIRRSYGVEVIFGEPVEKDGVTIIPVARASGGGGGGLGEGEDAKKDEKGSGMGFGFGVSTKPYGYIEIKDGNAEFIRLDDTRNKLIAAGAGLLAGLMLAGVFAGGAKVRQRRRARRTAVSDEEV